MKKYIQAGQAVTQTNESGAAMGIVIDTSRIPAHVMEMLCRPLVSIVENYYKDPARIVAFIEWHKRKYGSLPSNYQSLQESLKEAGGES